MAGRIFSFFRGLSSNTDPALKSLSKQERVHVHHTNVPYSDDQYMQEFIAKQRALFSSGTTHTHDPHSLSPCFNYLDPQGVLVINSSNLLLSNLYLLNNDQTSIDFAVTQTIDEFSKLFRLVHRDFSSNGLVFILGSIVSGDYEVRSLQGSMYQKGLARLNAFLTQNSHNSMLALNKGGSPIVDLERHKKSFVDQLNADIEMERKLSIMKNNPPSRAVN